MRNIFDLIKKKDEEKKEREDYDEYIDNDGAWVFTATPMSDDDILIATDKHGDYYLKPQGDLESNMILRKKK